MAQRARIDRLLDRLPREFFLLAAFAFLVGIAPRSRRSSACPSAIGALMAGVVLSETSVREEIEERFFSFRDVFAALFFFVFGLSIDVGELGSVGWLARARGRRDASWARSAAATCAGLLGGFSPRQSLNAGVALVAHGEFTIILAQLAAGTRESRTRSR